MRRRLLVLGGWNAVSPRHRVLSRGLAEHNVAMRHVPLEGRVVTRARALARVHPDETAWAEILFLPKIAQHDALAATWLARRRRRPLVADYFASLHLTEVIDRRRAAPGSPRALRAWALDRLLSLGPNHFIVDTAAHRDLLAERYGLPADRADVVPVGAEPIACRPPRRRSRGDPLHVLFVAHFAPLHGADVVLDAARRLGNAVRFTFIGDGRECDRVRDAIARIGLDNVVLHPAVPHAELAPHVDASDAILGIFGRSPKARVVIPKKAFLALSAGRPLVTADTPAAREWLVPDETALLVRPGDPAALAEAIAALRDDPALGLRVGAAGRRLHLREFTPERVAARFLALPVWPRTAGVPETAGAAA